MKISKANKKISRNNNKKIIIWNKWWNEIMKAANEEIMKKRNEWNDINLLIIM